MDDPQAPHRLPRRARLKRQREERILDAAATVISRKGYHQATIHEIAELADVADGTIYNYFSGKPDLLIGLMARLADVEQLPAELVAALQGDGRSFFVAAFDQRLGHMLQGEELLKAILPQVFVDPELGRLFHREYLLRIASVLEHYVQAQVDLGQIRPVDVPLTVRLVQAVFVGLLFLRVAGDATVADRWSEMARSVADLFFDGLSPAGSG